MQRFDIEGELRKWFIHKQQEWNERSVKADLKIGTDDELNKLLVTLEAVSLLATITIWKNGMLEFIVFDRRTKSELRVYDKEFDTSEQFRLLLDSCAIEFFETK